MLGLVLVIGIDFIIVLFFLQLLNPSACNIGWGTVIASWLVTIVTSWVLMISFIGVIEYITQDYSEAGSAWFGLPLGLIAGHVLGFRFGAWRLRKQAHQDEDERTQMERQMNRVQDMLSDPTPDMRLNAITELTSIHDVRTFPLFSQAMRDADVRVRNEAAIAFGNVCIAVPRLLFRENIVTRGEHDMISEMTGLTRFHTRLQFRLRTIIIHTKTCHRDQVNAFVTQTLPALDERLLKRYVTIRIDGNPHPFCDPVYRILNRCKTVDVNITALLFGTPPSCSSVLELTWQNPDLTDFLLPLMHVTQIIIDAATCDPRLVERFLTYAVNYYDQRYLQKHVEVHLYGDSEKLHPNLRNSLTNLCKNVFLHEEYDQNHVT